LGPDDDGALTVDGDADVVSAGGAWGDGKILCINGLWRRPGFAVVGRDGEVEADGGGFIGVFGADEEVGFVVVVGGVE
jgi:hypothetical protein